MDVISVVEHRVILSKTLLNSGDEFILEIYGMMASGCIRRQPDYWRATTPWLLVKKQLTIRVDADVLDWLRAQGKGYQILRVVMESQLPYSEN